MLRKEIDYWQYGKDKVDMHSLLTIIRLKTGIPLKLLISEILKEFGLMFISVIVLSQIKQLVTLNFQVRNHNQ